MSIKNLLSFFLLVIAIPVAAQQHFEKRIDIGQTTNAFSIAQYPGGDYIICSRYRDSATPPDNSRISLTKTDESGKILWMKSSITLFSDYFASAFATHDLGFTLVTEVAVGSNYRTAVIKFDSTGNAQWTRVLGTTSKVKDSRGLKGIETSDHGYAIISTGCVVTKLDSVGKFVWSHAVCKTSATLGDIIQGADSSLYISASDLDFHRTEIIHLSVTGSLLWHILYKVADSILFTDGACMTRSGDGGFVLSGLLQDTTKSWVHFIKVDSAGAFQWNKRIEVEGSAYFESIAQAANGDLLYTGEVTKDPLSPTSDSMLLIRLSQTGDVKLVTMMTMPNITSYANAVITSIDSSFVVVGTMYRITAESGGVGNTGLLLMKFREENDVCNLESIPFTTPSFAMTFDRLDTMYDPMMNWDTLPTQASAPLNYKEVDLCSVNGVAETRPVSQSLSLYPNPLPEGKQLVIHTTDDLPSSTYEISLLDLLGNIVIKEKVSVANAGQDIFFDIPKCASGMYMIELQSISNLQIYYREKFIKQ
jgi:hypothetical protein